MKFRSLILFVSLAASASAQIVTLTPPAADTLLSATNASSNYGRAGAAAISGGSTAKGEFDSLFRFDFAAAKVSFDTLYGARGWLLQSVTLTLTAQAPTNVLFNASAAGQLGIKWLQNDAWVEGTGSPNTPTTDGLAFNGLAALGTNIPAADKPKLTVMAAAVPEPASAGLAALGALSLLARRMRRTDRA